MGMETVPQHDGMVGDRQRPGSTQLIAGKRQAGRRRVRRLRSVVSAAAVSLVSVAFLASVGPADAVAGGQQPFGPAGTSASDSWPMFHHDPLHSGVSTDTAIGASTAASLTQKWAQVVGSHGHVLVVSSPAVVYNTKLKETIVYDVDNNGTVHAFNATTGATVWIKSVGGSVQSSPAIYDNTLYLGNTRGYLSALNATTGAVQCTFKLPVVAPETVPGRVQSSPVVGVINSSGPMVFFGDEGQKEALNAGHEWAITGVGNTAGGCHKVWAFNGFKNKGPDKDRTGSWDQPGLVQDSAGKWLVVFGSANPDDAVYAVNADTGAMVWRFQTKITSTDEDVGAGPTISPPGANGFADGVVYIDGKDKYEYAINLLTGAEIWSFRLQTTPPSDHNCVSVAALVDNRVYVPFSGVVYALNATTGALVWKTASQGGAILSSPAVSGAPGHRVLFVGDTNGSEFGFRLTDGKLVFTAKVGYSIIDSAAIADGRLFFADYHGDLMAYAPTKAG
jgi:outer membrane protein assembly factor BamB